MDTAKILQHQAILWKLGSGGHTVTSGTGSTDPNVGHLFDVNPLTAAGFIFTFDSAGTGGQTKDASAARYTDGYAPARLTDAHK